MAKSSVLRKELEIYAKDTRMFRYLLLSHAIQPFLTLTSPFRSRAVWKFDSLLGWFSSRFPSRAVCGG